jgi:hypothetical protein
MVEAALRAMAIQKGMGISQNVFERLTGETGLVAVPWVDKPDNASAAGPSPGEASASGAAPELPAIATAFDGFIAGLAPGERGTFESSIVMLLSEVVRADAKFDRLERVEIDWTMNFQVPAALGEAFRFSKPAEAEYRALIDGGPRPDPRPFDDRLAELGAGVERLPEALRASYRRFVAEACASAAESSGEWLWFGTKVSKEEKAVLSRIENALGIAAPS